MKYDKFFEIAKAKGLASAQIQISCSTATNIQMFHHEIDSYSVQDSRSIIACGVYNGKFASAKTEKLDKNTFDFLVDQIIENATYSEKEGTADLFEGSEKYHKKNVYNANLAATPISAKLDALKALECAIYAACPDVTDAEARFSEREVASEFYNSFGLKLKQKSNYFYYLAGAVIRKGEETKTYYDVTLDNDLAKFDPKALAEKVVNKALAKFGGAPCKGNKYPTVLSSDIVASLTAYYLSSCSAEEVQKHSSFLEGKLGTKIASSKLTIEERPLDKNVFFSYFDDEGVATYNKPIVKSGKLVTYLYNRETAKKDGVKSTGNGAWAGGKMGISHGHIWIKPGKQSFDQLISDIKEGVYITEIAGLGTGINVRSGDFSCQAEGFMIRDGKLAEPLNLITLSGNLLKMFKDLKGFDSNLTLTNSAFSCADAYIKSMSIGGN